MPGERGLRSGPGEPRAPLERDRRHRDHDRIGPADRLDARARRTSPASTRSPQLTWRTLRMICCSSTPHSAHGRRRAELAPRLTRRRSAATARRAGPDAPDRLFGYDDAGRRRSRGSVCRVRPARKGSDGLALRDRLRRLRRAPRGRRAASGGARRLRRGTPRGSAPAGAPEQEHELAAVHARIGCPPGDGDGQRAGRASTSSRGRAGPLDAPRLRPRRRAHPQLRRRTGSSRTTRSTPSEEPTSATSSSSSATSRARASIPLEQNYRSTNTILAPRTRHRPQPRAQGEAPLVRARRGRAGARRSRSRTSTPRRASSRPRSPASSSSATAGARSPSSTARTRRAACSRTCSSGRGSPTR